MTHRKDKKRIKFYQEALVRLKSVNLPGREVEIKKKGLLRTKTVGTRIVFDNVEEAATAKRQAAELKRAANLVKKEVRRDMKSIRQFYREEIAGVGSGAGLMDGILGSKQKVIQEKAKRKRKLASERDTRLADYERVLRQLDRITYTCDAWRSAADEYIAQNK